MKKQTNVVRRGAIYYYRARYPSDLVTHFGKAEFSISLQTKDIREANSKANIQQLKYDQEFSQVRAMLSPSNEPSDIEFERIVETLSEQTLVQVDSWVNSLVNIGKKLRYI